MRTWSPLRALLTAAATNSIGREKMIVGQAVLGEELARLPVGVAVIAGEIAVAERHPLVDAGLDVPAPDDADVLGVDEVVPLLVGDVDEGGGVVIGDDHAPELVREERLDRVGHALARDVERLGDAVRGLDGILQKRLEDEALVGEPVPEKERDDESECGDGQRDTGRPSEPRRIFSHVT